VQVLFQSVIKSAIKDYYNGTGSNGRETHISILKPFSTGGVTKWFQQFEICCTSNSWSDEVKAIKLPMLLEGEALAVWLELRQERL